MSVLRNMQIKLKNMYLLEEKIVQIKHDKIIRLEKILAKETVLKL